MKRGDLITTNAKRTLLWCEDTCTYPSGVIGSITHNDIILVLQIGSYKIEVLCNGAKGWIDIFKSHTLTKLA